MNANPYVEDNRDSDIFTADYARKTLVVPEGNRVFGVKGDHYGRCFRCKLLNYPDTTVRFTHDTAVAYLQFENAAGETGSVKLKIEETTNRNDANKEGDTAVLLSATIPNSLTKEAGTARLQLCGSYQASNGTWIHWHLAPVEVEIADFFDNEEIAKSDPKYNLVEQAHTEINALSTKVADLQKALQTSLEDIKSALDSLDESNLPDSVLTQVTANRASIQALQQKITTLENAGVDIDSLSETFATLEAVAAEYETKVHASETYMRKDDSDYANVVNRVKILESGQSRLESNMADSLTGRRGYGEIVSSNDNKFSVPADVGKASILIGSGAYDADGALYLTINGKSVQFAESGTTHSAPEFIKLTKYGMHDWENMYWPDAWTFTKRNQWIAEYNGKTIFVPSATDDLSGANLVIPYSANYVLFTV